MENVYLVPQKATFEIQDFTYVYVVDKNGVAKIRSFQPLERYGKFYVTQDFEPGTTIVYEGIQGIKDGSTIKADTVKFQNILMESYHTTDTTHKQ